MNLKALLIIGLFGMFVTASEIPCTLYLYPSKPDPENLYDATRSFILPFGRVVTIRGVRLPLKEESKWLYEPQYYTKPINSVKYIVAKGNQCDLCWINALDGPYMNVFVDPPVAGEIYTLDKCNNFIEINCQYFYPRQE